MKLTLRSQEKAGGQSDSTADWLLVCLSPQWGLKLNEFPLLVGSSASCDVVVEDERVARRQFQLEKASEGTLTLTHLGGARSPTYFDGSQVCVPMPVDSNEPHLLVVGRTILGLGHDVREITALIQANADILSGLGIGTPPPGGTSDAGLASSTDTPHYASVGEPVLGESFRCPYCRAVAPLEDVLSVSVSPSLKGDPILGQHEQKRFLPSRFTQSGQAIDPKGGVCTEVACPRCHMSLPQVLLETQQIIMSVIGATGAGKSVFLASCVWTCRQKLNRLFGIGFRDLDPVANRWINAYEEKLFFQSDDQALKQIEKTDVNASNVCRAVMLDGAQVSLPLPSFFQLKPGDGQPHGLVVYDSAGEHFVAGGDVQSSSVTLNMLDADVLFFMFDPSADPRFRPMLERGQGTAQNSAQRQDVLLAEMSARIQRHLGN